MALLTPSSAALTFHPSTSDPSSSRRSQILTLLHKTTSLLPRTLHPYGESLSLWEGALQRAWDDVNSSASRNVRIAVFSIDPSANSQDFITAFLDDPLSLTEDARTSLRERWNACPQKSIVFSYGSTDINIPEGVITIPSPWLSRLNATIVELSPEFTNPMPVLAQSDIAILLAGPFLQIDDRPMVALPNSLVLINDPHHPHLPLAKIEASLQNLHTQAIASADLSQSIQAIDQLTSRPRTSSAVESYQQLHKRSRLSSLHKILERRLLSGEPPDLSVDIGNIKLATARHVLHGSLSAIDFAVKNVEGENKASRDSVGLLRKMIWQTELSSRDQVYGEPNLVRKAVEKSEKTVRSAIDTLKWWRLPLQIDDLGPSLTRVISHAWCRDLETHLVFHAGRLSVLQTSIRSSTQKIISSLPDPIRTPILINDVAQTTTTAHNVQPFSLASPIISRLAHLNSPVARLHSTAQKLVLSTATSSLVSIAGAYLVWSVHWMQGETALAAGLFGIFIGLRRYVKKWDSAKKRWWESWTRVGEGLQRDLQKVFEDTLNENITAPPRKAADNLEQQLRHREDDLDSVKTELQSLQAQLEKL
ncbi:hypothetical protein SISSUDRAFT_1058570 [Sistotremastrum suecicum HHB10207 ss-3]|uniref:Mmc1 C-terminal domain-containing protein n=1 Tax=Sistotremastrum suecicum HHB10207 ss-3 TaxID=1314776 RepID=A0A166H9N8_9AGAM|nr:hypothetical protein SISSUDRAFT_1058570 [Sistotremastrum suecicum HHB10207 ss-3]